MRDLGTLGGGSGGANDINDRGQVVGGSLTNKGELHAFIAGPDNVGMTDLGTLGRESSWATGINDAGQVVGIAAQDIYDSGFVPFITGPNGGGMTDLNSVVSLPDGSRLTRAMGINNLGQIIATSMIPISVIPEPSTYALMLAGLGLVGFMVVRRTKTNRLSG